MAQYLAVMQNQKITLDVTFSCAHENAVVLKEYGTGQELFNGNSHMNGNRHWESPKNTSPNPKIYELRAYHKNTPPDGGQPWYESPERIVYANAITKVVGYEDLNDGDYNDAVATVGWKRA